VTIATTTTRNNYTGNGVTTAFAYTWKCLVATDMAVYVGGVLQASGYTVAGVGEAAGGSVTFTTAPASGAAVSLISAAPMTQAVDLVENDPLPAQTVEGAFDKVTRLVQQLNETVGRAVKFGTASLFSGVTFPDLVANRYLRVNGGATGLELVALAASGTYADPITTKGDVLVGGATGVAARKAVGADGQVLAAAAAQTDGLLWVPPSTLGTPILAVASGTSLSLGVGVIPLLVGSTWTRRAIPAALTIANTGLAATTGYYVYAYDSLGSTVLELSTTAHEPDATWGVEVKSGDATRTLVGFVITIATTPGQFMDADNKRLVISWFPYSRRTKTARANFGASVNTTGTGLDEMAVGSRVEFVTWVDEDVIIQAHGGCVMTGAGTGRTSIGIDDTTAEDTAGRWDDSVSAGMFSNHVVARLTEGWHYATLLAGASANALTIEGSGAAGSRTTITATIRG
jgi:hypothetical protein